MFQNNLMKKIPPPTRITCDSDLTKAVNNRVTLNNKQYIKIENCNYLFYRTHFLLIFLSSPSPALHPHPQPSST